MVTQTKTPNSKSKEETKKFPIRVGEMLIIFGLYLISIILTLIFFAISLDGWIRFSAVILFCLFYVFIVFPKIGKLLTKWTYVK